MMARECGYRLEIETVDVEKETGTVSLVLRNAGCAPFREKYTVGLCSGGKNCFVEGDKSIESGEKKTFVFPFRPGEELSAGVSVRGIPLELGNENIQANGLVPII